MDDILGQKKRKAYRTYTSKMRMLGIAQKEIDYIFEVGHFDDVNIHLFKFAKMKAFPRVLNIPSFVDNITCINVRNSEDKLKNIKKINIPDNVDMNANSFKALNVFSELEVASITTRQYIAVNGLKYKIELRVPEEANMIVTDKTRALTNFIMSKYTSDKATGEELFLTFEVAARTSNEDVVLAALALFAVENSLCSINEIKSYVAKNIAISIIEMQEQSGETEWHKAAVIKRYSWLRELFDIKRVVEKKYGIENEHLNIHLMYPGNKVFDIGQKFKAKLKVDENVMNGLKGYGGLGYFKYILRGNISHSTALDIIRLTSEYNGNLIDELVFPTGKFIELDFYKQYWFHTHNSELFTWCYPNGGIHASGYRSGMCMGQLIMESCFLASAFKGLKMEVIIIAESETFYNRGDEITIKIRKGFVEVGIGSKSYYDLEEIYDGQYIDKVNELRKTGQTGLDEYEIQEIFRRNKRDADEDKQHPDELANLVCDIDRDLQMRLEYYIAETTGMYLFFHGETYSIKYNMLKFLFDFDMEKLRQYTIDYKKGRKQNLEEII